ncbi:MAG: hypothetical protein R2850_07710 [Bacteroidia bacterium]
MKTARYFLILLITALLPFSMPACKNNGKARNGNETMKDLVQLSDTSHYSLLVSFYSIGSGIDHKVAKEYDNFIKSFEAEHTDEILVERIHWGREGELDFCMRFTGLKPADQKILLDRTNEIISKSKWVNHSTDTPCKRKRN